MSHWQGGKGKALSPAHPWAVASPLAGSMKKQRVQPSKSSHDVTIDSAPSSLHWHPKHQGPETQPC